MTYRMCFQMSNLEYFGKPCRILSMQVIEEIIDKKWDQEMLCYVTLFDCKRATL